MNAPLIASFRESVAIIWERRRLAGMLAVLLTVCAWAQDQPTSATGAAPVKSAPPGTNDTMKSAVSGVNASEQSQPATTQPPNSVQEVLKMMEAGVSKEVLKAYVENSRSDYIPTAQDLILLKQHGVPDDIATALVKRSGEVQAQKAQAAPNAAVPINLANIEQDPEGYGYFQRYYLFPRTLAYTYETLNGSYAPGFLGYYPPFGPGYGYGGPFLRPGAGVRFFPPGAIPPH
jgi:hypothetical protein